MSLDSIVTKKNRLLEELLRLTAQMQMHLMKNDMHRFDEDMDHRGRLLNDIRKIDEELKGHPTQADDLWVKQLRMVTQSDQEIIQILQQHRDAVVREVVREEQAKDLVLQGSTQESRGQQIQVRG